MKKSAAKGNRAAVPTAAAANHKTQQRTATVNKPAAAAASSSSASAPAAASATASARGGIFRNEYGGYLCDGVNSSSVIPSIDYSSLSAESFYSSYVIPRRPVILRNFSGSSAVSSKSGSLTPAAPSEFASMAHKWLSVAYLRAQVGDTQVRVEWKVEPKTKKEEENKAAAAAGKNKKKSSSATMVDESDAAAKNAGGFTTFGRGQYEWMSFNRFLDYIHSPHLLPTSDPSITHRDHSLYLTSQPIGTDVTSGAPVELCAEPISSLMHDLPLRPAILPSLVPIQYNTWIGQHKQAVDAGEKPFTGVAESPFHRSPGTTTGLHHDYHDNIYYLVNGNKFFHLFPPSDAENMYCVGVQAKESTKANGKISVRQPGCHVHRNGLIEYVEEAQQLWEEEEEEEEGGKQTKNTPTLKEQEKQKKLQQQMEEEEEAEEEDEDGEDAEREDASDSDSGAPSSHLLDPSDSAARALAASRHSSLLSLLTDYEHSLKKVALQLKFESNEKKKKHLGNEMKGLTAKKEKTEQRLMQSMKEEEERIQRLEEEAKRKEEEEAEGGDEEEEGTKMDDDEDDDADDDAHPDDDDDDDDGDDANSIDFNNLKDDYQCSDEDDLMAGGSQDEEEGEDDEDDEEEGGFPAGDDDEDDDDISPEEAAAWRQFTEQSKKQQQIKKNKQKEQKKGNTPVPAAAAATAASSKKRKGEAIAAADSQTSSKKTKSSSSSSSSSTASTLLAVGAAASSIAPLSSSIAPSPCLLESFPSNFTRLDFSTLSEEQIREQFPLYVQKCKPIVVQIAQGDALYLPASWFHEVFSAGSSVGSAAESNNKKTQQKEKRVLAAGGEEEEPLLDSSVHFALNYWFQPPSDHTTFDVPYALPKKFKVSKASSSSAAAAASALLSPEQQLWADYYFPRIRKLQAKAKEKDMKKGSSMKVQQQDKQNKEAKQTQQIAQKPNNKTQTATNNNNTKNQAQNSNKKKKC